MSTKINSYESASFHKIVCKNGQIKNIFIIGENHNSHPYLSKEVYHFCITKDYNIFKKIKKLDQIEDNYIYH